MFFKGYIPQIIRPGLFKEYYLHNIDINLLRIYYKHRYENADNNKDNSKIIRIFNIINNTNFSYRVEKPRKKILLKIY